MIQNLNFYDIYGYLLPGLTFLSLMWLPFGLLDRQLPSEKLSSALLAIAIAYITGHVLQMIAQSTLPSDTKDPTGKRRFPSDLILDADDKTFSSEFKKSLWRRIGRSFGIDVQVHLRSTDITTESLKDLSKRRGDAFLLCRSALVRGKSVFYGEQLEGMYALMRGLTTALLAGAIYHVGWTVAAWSDTERDKHIAVTVSVLFVGVVGSLILILLLNQILGNKRVKPLFDRLGQRKTPGRETIKQLLDRFPLSTLRIKPKTAIVTFLLVSFALIAEYYVGEHYLSLLAARWSWIAVAFGLTCALLAAIAIPDAPRFHLLRVPFSWLRVLPVLYAMFAVGYGLGVDRNPDSNQRGQLILIVIAGVFVALKCNASYRVFAQEFPKAIYRDFAVLELGSKPDV